MRTTTLRAVPHIGEKGEVVAEVWHGEEMIAAVYGLNGKVGVHVVSKYPLTVVSTGEYSEAAAREQLNGLAVLVDVTKEVL